MCGIWVLLDQANHTLSALYESFLKLSHRGPDHSIFEVYKSVNANTVVGFHRLAIVNSSAYGNQPFVIEDDERRVVFVCNGEIYNWKALRDKYGLSCDNDCMVIPLMYMKCYHMDYTFQEFVAELQGEFAFVLMEFRENVLDRVIAARDEIGVRPMYSSANMNSELFFTSEVKGAPDGIPVREFPPGTVSTFYVDNGMEEVYDFSRVYGTLHVAQKDDVHLLSIEKAVRNAVKRRLSASKPFAYLLSGGVDSSLVAALGANAALVRGLPPIKTFCCSIKPGTYQIGSGEPFTTDVGTDLLYAREVAAHIGSDHTEVFFTPQMGLGAISDVIRTVESWDTTTVRASVGQYMVCKWIGENTHCKVVMVGEGPDEVCSSYLFNWYAPDGDALAASAQNYVENIHYYDVKRADRCISRWGLEGRVPLLDPDFIRAYWEIPGSMRLPKAKGIEKWWLRAAFDGQGGTSSLLPASVLWRKKEAFSDGVSASKSWYQMIQDFVDERVTDDQLKTADMRYPYCTPVTKEAYYYRMLFESHFPERAEIIPGFWQPKWDADGVVTTYVDPSARTLGSYQ